MKLKNMMRTILGPFYASLTSIPKIVNAPSYYPERKRKVWLRRYAELVFTRFRHGLTDQYYNAYGKDCVGFDGASYVQEYDFWRKIVPLNYAEGLANHAIILRDKYLFDIFMRAHGIPVPEVAGTILGGRCYLPGGVEVSGDEFFAKMADARCSFFVKDATSCCAKGVAKIENVGGILQNSATGRKITVADFGNGKFVVQKALGNCPEIDAIQPASVNTLRIVTLWNRRKGIAQLLSAGGLRVGGGGTVDNWAQGGLFVGIGETGALLKYGYYKPGKHVPCKTDRQPLTGYVFEGTKIPFYQNAVELVLRAHALIPEVYAIGWDVALTTQGPVIIEGNDDWEITLMQMVAGGLSKRFKESGFSR